MQSNVASGCLTLTKDKEEGPVPLLCTSQALQQPGQSLPFASKRECIQTQAVFCSMFLSSLRSVQELWHDLEEGRRNMVKGFSPRSAFSWVHRQQK